MSRHPDISNEEKSVIATNSAAKNLSELRRMAREHRETVAHLRVRCEKMEREYTKILLIVTALGLKERKDWKD